MMNRAPRELIDDLREALIAERQARQALREATCRSVGVIRELRAAGVTWTLIARHVAQLLGRPVSEVGRLAATLRQRAWSVSRPHEIRSGASGAGTAISSSSSGRAEIGGKDNEMPTEQKKIIKRTTTVEEFELAQPQEEDFELDEGDESDDGEDEGHRKARGKKQPRAA